jgi:integrase
LQRVKFSSEWKQILRDPRRGSIERRATPERRKLPESVCVPIREKRKEREGEKQEERFFTAEQVKQIINASEEPYSTLWAVLSLTGCRAGEVFALRRTDLDFKKRVIRIRRTLDAATGQTHAPKSRSSSADLPMPDALGERLRTFLAQHWRENEADLLFCNTVGKPMVRNKVALKLQATLKDLGIERAALHAFRHYLSFLTMSSPAVPAAFSP